VESWLVVTSANAVDGPESLTDWLSREGKLSGRVRLVHREPEQDQSGSWGEVLSVAVGVGGGTLTALAGSLSVWLRQPRHATVRVAVAKPDGTKVEITGAHPRGAYEIEDLLRNCLHPDGDQLFPGRVIVLDGEIKDEVANRITGQLLTLAAEDPAADISLYIDSTGGSVTAGMAIYDTMHLIEPDVATVAIGSVYGMAQMLLSAGMPGKRYALPHARIMLKPISAPGHKTEEEMRVVARWANEMTRLIAEQTGQPVERVRADANLARQFSAREACDYGIVDHVVAGLPAI